MLDEFSLIEKFCQRIGVRHPQTLLGVGDDAAIVRVPEGMQLAVSVDTMVAGVHFQHDTKADKLAAKLLAVNLSDMAAMGAEPKWATIALTMPQADDAWMADFSRSLHDAASRYRVEVIGGDTTRGSLSMSMQIMGLLPLGQGLTRAGAVPGDDVYVTGTLGDAALALECMFEPDLAAQLDVECLRVALDLPQPPVAAGRALLPLAHCCIDVSDGLIADLTHIARASGVSMEVEINTLPVSSEYRRYLHIGGDHDLLLCGGDDYQLAFTAAPVMREQIAGIASDLSLSISRIGTVKQAQDQPLTLTRSGINCELPAESGYRHFSGGTA